MHMQGGGRGGWESADFRGGAYQNEGAKSNHTVISFK